MSGVEVRDNRAESRFEARVDGHLAIAEYRLGEGQITFTHTLVPQELEGRGVGKALVRAGLDFARAQHLRVVPQCSFFKAYIDKHPEEQDLL